MKMIFMSHHIQHATTKWIIHTAEGMYMFLIYKEKQDVTVHIGKRKQSQRCFAILYAVID